MKTNQYPCKSGGPLALAAILVSAFPSMSHAEDAFLPLATNSSTIPQNGDVNPYGVAFVPDGFPDGGSISAGDVLVSNFNNSMNTQGTGTTIVRQPEHGPIAPPGTAITFFSSPLAGLSTALGVLRGGYVVVGNVATPNGSFSGIVCPKVQGSCALQVIDRFGHVKATWADPDGPWDLAIDDHGGTAHIFVSNVLSGKVVRFDVTVTSTGVNVQHKYTIASGYAAQASTAAVVLGPTGLAFDARTDTLYVASTADNEIFAVPGASQRTTPVTKGDAVFENKHLIGPLALRFAPNGDLLTANGDATPNADPLHPSEIVEFTRLGEFVREFNVDASQGGAFGLDARADANGAANFAYIDDVTNNLIVTRLRSD
jgi:DNA-binding beta-propeller fold protein YncE